MKEYIPKALRTVKDKDNVFGVGTPTSDTEIGIINGPFSSVNDALEIIGDENYFVYQIDKTKSFPIWKWNKDRWVALGEDVLSKDQKEALRRLNTWVLNTDPYFVLKGFAGSGKTFLLKQFVDKCERTVYLSSPTNKATKILSKSVGRDASTTYSTLGLRMVHDEDRLVLETTKSSYFPRNSLLIVDEAGTVGSLLLEAIEQVRIKYRLKVLFVGDPAQLNPVGEKKSRVWELATSKLNTAFLREVMRFDSELLVLATETRNSLKERNFFSPLQRLSNGDDIQQLSYTRFKEAAASEVAENPEEKKILCWRNKTASKYNQIVRDKLGFTDPYHVGDVLLIASPIERNGTIVAHIDEEFRIKSVDEHVETIKDVIAYPIDIPCYKLFVEGDTNMDLLICNDEYKLEKVLSMLSSNAKKAKKSKKKEWKKFWDVRNKFNQVRYGYAMTVHRSQGSTYEKVFVDQRDILLNQNSIEAFRCLYVAFTRATTAIVSY